MNEETKPKGVSNTGFIICIVVGFLAGLAKQPRYQGFAADVIGSLVISQMIVFMALVISFFAGYIRHNSWRRYFVWAFIAVLLAFLFGTR